MDKDGLLLREFEVTWQGRPDTALFAIMRSARLSLSLENRDPFATSIDCPDLGVGGSAPCSSTGPVRDVSPRRVSETTYEVRALMDLTGAV